MTEYADLIPEPIRLDRAITWIGVGAATALAALLMMLALYGFATSYPRADNVGEEGASAAGGANFLILSLAVLIPAGWRLAHRTPSAVKLLFRALPILVSIVWTGLAWISMPFWLGVIDQLTDSLFIGQSLFTFGALPACVGLLIALLVLVIVRSLRRRAHVKVSLPGSDQHQSIDDTATSAPN